MKKAILILLLAGMLASILTGCGRGEAVIEPTMQLDIVQMTETAKAEPKQEAGVPESNLRQTVAAPEHCTDELVSEKGWLRVHVDADVFLPETNMPMVRVESKGPTPDEIRKYAQVLFDPEAKYVDWDHSELKTKGYWKLLIDELQNDIDHWEERGQFKWDMKYDTLSAAKAELNQWIENMEKAPESLPEITPVYEWSYSITEYASGKTEQWPYFHLYTTTDDANVSYLQCDEFLIHYVREQGKTHGILMPGKVNVSDKVNISMEQAYAIAEQTISKLGFEGMTCTYQAGMVSDYQEWYGYDFVYNRQVNGVPVTFVNHGSDGSGGEKIRITVDDKGVATLDYFYPMVITEKITDHAALLPFDQIKAVFDRMVMVVENQTESAAWNRAGMPDLEVDYYIKEIRLGLAPVKESGDAIKQLLVPAWDFIGYRKATVNGEEKAPIDTNEKTSFLTINAVDGTVIDRNG